VNTLVSNSYCYKKNILKDYALVRGLRREKYDIVIDMFDNPSTTSAVLIKLIRPDYSVGLDKENKFLYSHVVPLPDRRKVHIVERTANLLLPFGIDPAKIDLSLDYNISGRDNAAARELLGPKNKNNRLGINLSGSDKSKYWGTQNYIDFIRSVSKIYKDLDIVIFAMRKNADEVTDIVSATKSRQAPFVNSVHDYALMLATCDYLLTTDTSAVHFAAALKVPTIVLYSVPDREDNLKPWLPYKNKHVAVTTPLKSINEIAPFEVVKALGELLKI
jgi:ADP-heptose:LPS heptosyltransferase